MINFDRFNQLWQGVALNHDATHCKNVYLALADHYNEPHRCYHNLRHINACLNKLDKTEEHNDYQPCVEFAIWFHDVIYQPADKDNELNSAVWFKQHSQGHLAPSFIDETFDIIIKTQHREMPETLNEKYMVDIDLHGFGSSWRKFITDGFRIRNEFNSLDDAAYIAGQIKFLSGLKQRKAVFSSPYFYDNYEQQAQRNIERNIEVFEKLQQMPMEKCTSVEEFILQYDQTH